MLNRVVANTLPYMPKKLVWVFSKRYIAGESIEDGIQTSRMLNNDGMMVTVDLLGEFIKTIAQAEINKNDYLTIIDDFVKAGIDGNFSVKPTSFGLLIDKEKCYQFIREVVVKAKENNRFVRIDMEDSRCTSREIDLYLRLKKEFPANIGLVLQAYLKRTYNDIVQMLESHLSSDQPLNFRLCKGIYVEPASIAYKHYELVRKNFLDVLKLMLENGVYSAIATHDKYLVEESVKLIEKLNVSKDQYEFQMLYGVTPALRDLILENGHPMRIYVPFGKDWFGYCSRRIKENPKMAGDIIKALFVRG